MLLVTIISLGERATAAINASNPPVGLPTFDLGLLYTYLIFQKSKYKVR